MQSAGAFPGTQTVVSLAGRIIPDSARLEMLYRETLERTGFEPLAVAAIEKLSVGAAAMLLVEGRPLDEFLEQVGYFGRRLAKLQVAPDRAAEALLDYHRLLAPMLDEAGEAEASRLRWAMAQLHLRTQIALNDAAYQVREAEAQTLLDLFHDELVSRSVDHLLQRFLVTLTRYCRASRGNLYLFDGARERWVLRAATGGQGQGVEWRPAKGPAVQLLSRPIDIESGQPLAHCILDASWRGRYPSCWSVPLQDEGKLSGVFQFGFEKSYRCLPRERELLSAAAERCSLAMEKARLTDTLSRSEEQVRKLARSMIQVEEAERRRVSRELHDEAGQSLLCIRLHLEMIEQAAEAAADAGLKARLAETREITERTIVEMRRLIAALSPAALEQLGLGAALRQLVQRFRAVFSGQVRYRGAGLDGLTHEVEISIYRILQECCNNIAKHSGATIVNLSVQRADRWIRVQAEDNGVGFDAQKAFERAGSHGLRGLRERVTLLGGRLEVDSRPSGGKKERKKTAGAGTTIRIWLPAREADPAEEDFEGNEYVEDQDRACG